MEDMLEDMLEMDEDEEITEEADAEVDKVLFELTNGKLGQAGAVGTELPVSGLPETVPGLESDLQAVFAGQAGGRRDGEDDGAVPPAAKWATKWLGS